MEGARIWFKENRFVYLLQIMASKKEVFRGVPNK